MVVSAVESRSGASNSMLRSTNMSSRSRSMSRQRTDMARRVGAGSASARRGWLPGPALGVLGYRGERLAKAGEGLGITVKAIARGHEGRSVPAAVCWVVEGFFRLGRTVEHHVRGLGGPPRRARYDCLHLHPRSAPEAPRTRGSECLTSTNSYLPLRRATEGSVGHLRYVSLPIPGISGPMHDRRPTSPDWCSFATSILWGLTGSANKHWLPCDQGCAMATGSFLGGPMHGRDRAGSLRFARDRGFHSFLTLL